MTGLVLSVFSALSRPGVIHQVPRLNVINLISVVYIPPDAVSVDDAVTVKQRGHDHHPLTHARQLVIDRDEDGQSLRETGWVVFHTDRTLVREGYRSQYFVGIGTIVLHYGVGRRQQFAACLPWSARE